MVRLRSWQARSHPDRSASRPLARHSRATCTSSSSAALASDTMPKSGPNTRPIWVGSMSMWTKVRSLVNTSMPPVWRFAQRLPMPITKSDASIVALP